MKFFHFNLEKYGYRHFVCFMLFLGMANAYIMRTNMSVAIVAMVSPDANVSKKSVILNLKKIIVNKLMFCILYLTMY